MKIIFAIPAHLKTVPMGEFCYQALLELGHEVRLFNFKGTRLDSCRDKITCSTKTGGEDKYHTNRRLRKLVDTFKPDAFITLFGFDVSETSLQYLKERGIPTVCYWINDPFQFERSLKKAPLYDYLFTNSSECAEKYQLAGATEAHFLPQACHPAIHRSTPACPSYASDVVFAGDWSPEREKMMASLSSRFNVRIFGPWKKKLGADSPLFKSLVDGFFTPYQMAQMFCSSKVVVNLHTWYSKFDHGVNPRLFEAAGCGAFQVVDWKQEIPSLFDCEKEVRVYRHLDELGDVIEDALSDHERLRRMGSASQARAYAEHTYVNRMHRIIRHLK